MNIEWTVTMQFFTVSGKSKVLSRLAIDHYKVNPALSHMPGKYGSRIRQMNHLGSRQTASRISCNSLAALAVYSTSSGISIAHKIDHRCSSEKICLFLLPRVPVDHFV